MNKKTNVVLRDAKKQLSENRGQLVNIESFVKTLNRDPKIVKTNKFANNTQYVPISHVQTLLDELFFGLWATQNFTYKVIANELVGSIELRVYHPILKEWITRTGVAATQIRQTKGADLTDIGAKIKNALEMDAAHLYADCVKSAAKTLGAAFGRNLNRDYTDNYNARLSEYVNKNTYDLKIVLNQIAQMDTVNGLNELYDSNPFFEKDEKILIALSKRKNQINGL